MIKKLPFRHGLADGSVYIAFDEGKVGGAAFLLGPPLPVMFGFSPLGAFNDGQPIFPAQYANSRRIACDAWHKIKQTEYTLNATTYGWWLSHVYCYNDPDHLVLEGVSEGENRARLTSGIVTGLFLLGDDFSQGGDPRTKERARRMLGNPAICTLAASRSNFRPVEHGSDKASNAFIWLCEDGSSYLALFNYDKTAYDYTFDLERLGLSPGTSYRATELWSGRTLTIADRTVQTIGAKDCQLFRLEPFTE